MLTLVALMLMVLIVVVAVVILVAAADDCGFVWLAAAAVMIWMISDFCKSLSSPRQCYRQGLHPATSQREQ